MNNIQNSRIKFSIAGFKPHKSYEEATRWDGLNTIEFAEEISIPVLPNLVDVPLTDEDK